MSASAHHLSRVTRPVKKLEKPRPLKISNSNRHSTIDARLGTVEEIMALADGVAMHLSNGNYDKTLQSNIVSLNGMFKAYGQKLEVVYKDQLDRAFVTFRNGSRDERLDYVSRLHLLELIELRATQWTPNDNSSYYRHKFNDVDLVPTPALDNSMTNSAVFQNPQIIPISPVAAPQQLLLGPGELVKSSGKFAAPTKIPGKNYCKDEVVIRNSDSGKVMGIKGRRVHMIEELSETVISFQRVSPGAKERLVQITGPAEDKINYAKQLMEETIRRNASPVRPEMPDKERLGSSSSLNSSTSDDSLRYQNSAVKRSTLLHSFSTSDATLGEYKYTVTVGEESLKITGTNLDLVRVAKLVLDEYFSPDSADQFGEYGFEEEPEYFEPVVSSTEVITRVNSQDSEESEETYKVQAAVPNKPAPLTKSSSFKSKSAPFASNRVQQSPTEKNTKQANVELSAVEQATDTQPFFPDTSPALTAEEMKVFSKGLETANQKKKGVTKVNSQQMSNTSSQQSGTTVLSLPKVLSYTSEEMIHYASSPWSRKTPDDWQRVLKEFPAIVKKTPFEWFDGRIYAPKRLQESDALNAIQSFDSGSPETE